MRNLVLMAAAVALVPFSSITARGQDVKPAPADAEAVRAVMRTASQALIDKDAKTFMSCCDPYVDCFFYDGTLVQGSGRIEARLNEFFAKRPEGTVVKPEAAPRSYRVLSPGIIVVDWPATLQGPGSPVHVNTLTTVRKTGDRWAITLFLQSVPWQPPAK